MNSLDLSPYGFFLAAGPVGKAVILILLVASIWCWVAIIEAVIAVIGLRAALRRWHRGEPAGQLAEVVETGRTAAALRIPGETVGDTRLRVIDAMNRAARSVLGNVEGGLPNLAVIASVAPFVGLFGTVWGIMSSFSAIAAAKDTSLAVVAPGIAEALATTAFGLFAAIPASIGYTRIGAAIGTVTEDFAGLIEREALQAVLPQSRPVPLKEAG